MGLSRSDSIIQMGTSIGDRAIVGAMGFVNKDARGGKWYGRSLVDIN